MWNKILDLLSNKRITRILLAVAWSVAKRTDNKVDEKLVKALELAMLGEDYGLQRKPTGPRKKSNGKTKKA